MFSKLKSICKRIMKIFRSAQAIHAEKPDGTRIKYYLFPEYEIHYNEIPPGTVQVLHHHEQIEETLLILNGELEVLWRNDKMEEQTATLRKGDVIRTEKTPHTFANKSADVVSFAVFKFVPSGINRRELLKRDKIIDQ